MTDARIAIHIISVFLLISFVAGKLIKSTARTSTAIYYSLGYLTAVITYINIIGALNNLLGRNWLNKEHKQGLMFFRRTVRIMPGVKFC